MNPPSRAAASGRSPAGITSPTATLWSSPSPSPAGTTRDLAWYLSRHRRSRRRRREIVTTVRLLSPQTPPESSGVGHCHVPSPVGASTRKSPSRSGSPGRANALRKAGNASVARRKLHSSLTGAPVRWSKDTTRGARQNAAPADTFKSLWRQGNANMSANHCVGDSRATRSAASVHAFNWPVRNQHRSCGAYARSSSRRPSEAGVAMNQHSHIRFDGS